MTNYPASTSDESTINIPDSVVEDNIMGEFDKATNDFNNCRNCGPRRSELITDGSMRLEHLSETAMMMNALGFIPACVSAIGLVTVPDTVFDLILVVIVLTSLDVIFTVFMHVCGDKLIREPAENLDSAYERYEESIHAVRKQKIQHIRRLARRFNRCLENYKWYQQFFIIGKICFTFASVIRVAHFVISIVLCYYIGKFQKDDIKLDGKAQVVFTIWIFAFNSVLGCINAWKTIFHGIDSATARRPRASRSTTAESSAPSSSSLSISPQSSSSPSSSAPSPRS